MVPAFYDILFAMRILVTNDDGLSSEGITVLSSILRSEHDVTLVAPHRNRSGVSHGISMTDPLQFRNEGLQVWSCSGLPVDCTLTGTLGIMSSPPDVVVSGINRGANIGTDILYSGTAAAARQASISGIPGIAVSMIASDGVFDWEPLARFVLNNLQKLMSLCERDVFVNINACSAASWKGARMTGISRRDYRDSVHMYDGPDGCKYSFFRGGDIHTAGDGESDYEAVESGYISISRVYAQPVLAPEFRGQQPVFQI